MFLLVILEVGKTQGLKFIQRKDRDLKVGHGYAARLEQARLRRRADESLFVGSGHGHYERMFIIKDGKSARNVKPGCVLPHSGGAYHPSSVW